MGQKFSIIVLTLATALVVMLSCTPEVHAQQTSGDLQFPYQAIVRNEATLIRSGPGQVHYATDELSQNSSVEVYRHDPGGWCAIRPVKGSFSLIPESAIEVIEEGIGQILEDGTQVWVGTQLGPVEKPLWQIKLKKDELVEVLGQATWPNPDGHSTVWYQIAPPAGEFRWIHISDLQVPPTLEQLVDTFAPNISVLPNRPVVTGNFDSQVQQATYQAASASIPPVSRPQPSLNQGWRQASAPILRDKTSSNRNGTPSAIDSEGNRPFSSDDNIPYLGQYQNNFSNRSTPPGNWSAPPRMASTTIDRRFDLDQLNPANPLNGSRFGQGASQFESVTAANSIPLSSRLAELELKLNNEMIKNPNQWRLINIQTNAESIYQSTSDPLERLQAQKLMKKLENCRDIRSGYMTAYNGKAPGSFVGANGAIGSGVKDIEDVSLSTTYDASGWLRELVRDGGLSQSTYVLKDDNDKITHHISAAPGLNLHRYLESKVGVFGQRGFHTGLKLDHVTAERVVELKRK